jgi:hypothetical protein
LKNISRIINFIFCISFY